MIRKYFFVVLSLILFTFNADATNYTSAANGNWMNPFTWTPIGVPIPGDNVTISHVVTLDTSFAYTSGTISVLGSLINDSFGRDIWLNGPSAQFSSSGIVTLRSILISSGSFVNSGVLNVKRVANFGYLTNNSLMQGVDSLYNDGEFSNNDNLRIMTFFNDSILKNYGTIQGLTTVVDSMYNNGTFTNFSNGLIKADSATNNGLFTNNGTIEWLQFTNYINGVFTNNNALSFDDMTNMGNFTNNGSIVGAVSMWNNEVFNNTSTGTITLSVSFLNADSLSNTASFNNDGSFDIGDSFYNFNTITGSSTGSFTMQDTSYNSGSMTGAFDFCDATPPPSYPYIDFNLGTIAPTITYCLGTFVSNTETSSKFALYPNPTKGNVYFGKTNQFVEVYDVLGQQIVKDYTNQINLNGYNKGVYFVVIKDKEGNQLYTEKLIKE